MSLTFKIIKEKCIPGETLLVDPSGCDRLYLGFTRGDLLITDCFQSDGATEWYEEHIYDWTYKPYEKSIKNDLDSLKRKDSTYIKVGEEKPNYQSLSYK